MAGTIDMTKAGELRAREVSMKSGLDGRNNQMSRAAARRSAKSSQ